jgi:hypothetical protein
VIETANTATSLTAVLPRNSPMTPSYRLCELGDLIYDTDRLYRARRGL